MPVSLSLETKALGLLWISGHCILVYFPWCPEAGQHQCIYCRALLVLKNDIPQMPVYHLWSVNNHVFSKEKKIRKL